MQEELWKKYQSESKLSAKMLTEIWPILHILAIKSAFQIFKDIELNLSICREGAIL